MSDYSNERFQLTVGLKKLWNRKRTSEKTEVYLMLFKRKSFYQAYKSMYTNAQFLVY